MSVSETVTISPLCVICYGEIGLVCSSMKNGDMNELRDMVEIFARYMKLDWDVQSIFDQYEVVPICQACQLDVITVRRIHVEIKAMYDNIDNIGRKVAARMTSTMNQFETKIVHIPAKPKNDGQLSGESVSEQIFQNFFPSANISDLRFKSPATVLVSRMDAFGSIDIHGSSLRDGSSAKESVHSKDLKERLKSNRIEYSSSSQHRKSSDNDECCSDDEAVEDLQTVLHDVPEVPAEVQNPLTQEKFSMHGIDTLPSVQTETQLDDSDHQSSKGCQDEDVEGNEAEIKSKKSTKRGRRGTNPIIHLGGSNYEYRGFKFNIIDGSHKCSSCLYSSLKSLNFMAHVRQYHLRMWTRTSRINSANATHGSEVAKGSNLWYAVLPNGVQCKFCDYTIGRKKDLLRHMVEVHPNEKRTNRTGPKQKPIDLGGNNFEYYGFSFKLTNGSFKCGSCAFVTGKRMSMMHHIRNKGSKAVESKNTEVSSYLNKNIELPQASIDNALETGVDTVMKISKAYSRINNYLRCDKCRKYSTKELTLMKEHLEHCEGRAKKYECVTCKKRFAYNYHLHHHARIHQEVKTYTCEKCGKSFKQESSFYYHRKFVHGSESDKKYVCDACGKRFWSSPQLKRHTKIHSEERTLICDSCDAKFKNPNNLELHKKIIHGGEAERHFECEQCGRKFVRRCALQYHLRVHVKERLHECTKCGKKFKTPENLKTHVAIHEPERDLPCPHCPGKFSGKQNLKRHIARKHSNATVKRTLPKPKCSGVNN